MAIAYTDEKRFTQDQIHELFASVGWQSAQYPDRVYRALIGSSTVISAWDGDQLAGLARVIDDGEMLAYMHWVLVNPKYQGMHVGSGLVCFASMSFQQAHQYFSAVWADGFPRSRHHAVSDVR